MTAFQEKIREAIFGKDRYACYAIDDCTQRVEDLIAECVADERKACAQIAAEFHNTPAIYFSDEVGLHNQTAIDIAESIRKRNAS